MKYQNTITGYVLTTNCEIKGENWVRLDSPSSAVAEKSEKPKKATRKSK